MLCLRYVSLSLSAQQSSSRRAKRVGFSSFFSAPPPPSTTFEVPPGGVALLVRDPIPAREVKAPDLHEWTSIGRMLAVKMVTGCSPVIVLVMYGFPKSHPRYADNEVMIAQAAAWASRLTTAVIWTGDLNMNVNNSHFVALPERHGFWRLNDNTPTTRDKIGRVSLTAALDHVFVNARMRDLAPAAKVRHDIWLSDHYPSPWNGLYTTQHLECGIGHDL